MSLIEGELVEIIAPLRVYARLLCKSHSYADDLVQDTLERALRYQGQFIPGSSLRAWVFRILRNKFRDDLRSNRRLVEDIDGENAARLISEPEQIWRLQYTDLLHAIEGLSPESQEAIILVMGAGLTHEEAALACGCPLGTLKSRVRRARLQLIDVTDAAAPG